MAVGVILVALVYSLGLVSSAPTEQWSPKDPINTDLAWGSCIDFGMTDPVDPNLSCGYYEVPMDYFDPAAGKARLAVMKYQATVPKKNGTLFVKFGAITTYTGLDPTSYVENLYVPAESGFQPDVAAQFSVDIQGQYDIISWDPRGTGPYTFKVKLTKTLVLHSRYEPLWLGPSNLWCFKRLRDSPDVFYSIPRLNHPNPESPSPGDVICFSTEAEEFAFWDNTVVRSINETISTNFQDKELNDFHSRVQETDAKWDEFGQRCLASESGPYLKYVGTSSNVRDLVSLADKIVGREQPIDFYGYSYGTIVGSHLLSLFPNRTGHMILDGAFDPTKWGRYDYDYFSSVDTEEVFTTFANACAQAGAAKCLPAGMIQGNVTGSDIRLLLTSTIDLALKLQMVGFTGLPAQSGELKQFLFNNLYFPEYWPTIMNQFQYPNIAAILTAGRAYGFNDSYIIPENPVGSPPGNSSDPPPRSHSLEAMVGADGAGSNGVSLKKVFDQIVVTTRNRTPTFGALWTEMTTIPKWPVRSVEPLPTFERRTLSNRVLVIGNSFDPITPLRNAKDITRLLGRENAVMVEHQAVGHTTRAQYSTCTRDIVANFLLKSQLPKQSTKCAVDSNDFFPDNPTNARRSYLRRK